MPVRPVATCLAICAVLLTTAQAADDPSVAVLARIDARADAYAKAALQIWDWASSASRSRKAVRCSSGSSPTRGSGCRWASPTCRRASSRSGKWQAGHRHLRRVRRPAGPLAAGRARARAHRRGGRTRMRAPHVRRGLGRGGDRGEGWLEQTKTPGTIRYYGSPAEEGGGGKVFMIRDGFLEDVDTVIAWHPGDRNAANASRFARDDLGALPLQGHPRRTRRPRPSVDARRSTASRR